MSVCFFVYLSVHLSVPLADVFCLRDNKTIGTLRKKGLPYYAFIAYMKLPSMAFWKVNSSHLTPALLWFERSLIFVNTMVVGGWWSGDGVCHRGEYIHGGLIQVFLLLKFFNFRPEWNHYCSTYFGTRT